MHKHVRHIFTVLSLLAFGHEALAQTTSPNSGNSLQTSGRERPPMIGDWYTTRTSASTDDRHLFLLYITAANITAGGGTVTITVNDAESALGGAIVDEVTGITDPTALPSARVGYPTVLSTVTLPAGSANGSTAVFSITVAGVESGRIAHRNRVLYRGG